MGWDLLKRGYQLYPEKEYYYYNLGVGSSKEGVSTPFNSFKELLYAFQFLKVIYLCRYILRV